MATTHIHPHAHDEVQTDRVHSHPHIHDQRGTVIHLHDHEVVEAHLDDRLVVAEARALSRPATSLFARYRPVLTSSDFLTALSTGVLALASWIASLTGADSLATPLGVGAALIGGVRIGIGAVRGLLRREMNVDELVAIAIVASVIVGEYLGAALVAFMMLFGKVLEDVTAARAEAAIEGLGALVPAVARIADRSAADGYRDVPVELVRPGEVTLVRPGERIPVDGRVVAGRANVEEAAITGESLPSPKQPGDDCFAGSLVTGGSLEIEATRVGEATALGRIAALVKAAEQDRAPIVRAADRWAKWFTPGVLALATIVGLVRQELLPAVAVLVVACPCALVLATPTAMVAGIARGARSGILLRGGSRLEAAGKIDVVCMDKTGTLTIGRPVLQRVLVIEPAGLAEDVVLAYAAAAERFSEHPLAQAVLTAAQERKLQLPQLAPDADGTRFEAFSGRGVRAYVLGTDARPVAVMVGNAGLLVEEKVPLPAALLQASADLEAAAQTPVVVAIDGVAVGLLAISDAVRPHAEQAIRALRAAGIGHVVLLTGDRPGPAAEVAAMVGIDPSDVHAGLLPEQKLQQINALRAQGKRVAMVGDGVNDAPALAASDVAIAMGGTGTDLAMSTADVILMSDDLRQVSLAVLISRRTLRTIWQNLFFAVAWNVVALGLVIFFDVGPALGAVIHNVGSVAVVVNAARLLNLPMGEPHGPGASCTTC